MPTPFENATLNLKLFDLRREKTLRDARHWFLLEFNPETFEEFVALVSGERNAAVRMVLGYWDMAASLVTTGAIDASAFLAAHTEVIGTFSKVQPFLAQLRAASSEPDFCKHMEQVVMSAPNAEATLARRRGLRFGVISRPEGRARIVKLPDNLAADRSAGAADADHEGLLLFEPDAMTRTPPRGSIFGFVAAGPQRNGSTL